MTQTLRPTLLSLSCAILLAQFSVVSPLMLAQSAAAPAVASPTAPDHAASYYHYGLAKLYEDQAAATGRQDLATQAIEQYKLALDADPSSSMLQNGIANLYFRLGRIREAITAAQAQIAKHPDDVDAHTLLGRVYLRSLGDMQGPQSNDMLQLALKEYETIARLKPGDLETHLLLGQLYGLNHDSAKAEEQFKDAQKIDGTNEEVVLSMARLYSEQGDLTKAAAVIADVPEGDRSGRMDFALAGLYDQLKEPKKAAAAYRAALDEDPDNADARRGLATALEASGQNDAAAKVYSEMLKSDPQDAQALIREAAIQRQQGHYEEALATLKKASALVSDNLELEYNEALAYDALGRFDEAISTLNGMLKVTASADGKYGDADKSNRALFLERLAIVDREAGKTSDAIAVYKQMEALGGEYEAHGADGEIQAYRDGHQWPQALQAAAAAAKSMPSNHDIQLTYASQLGDAGKVDEAVKVANAQLTGTPDDREVFFTVADIYARAKRWKESSVALDKVETLSTKPQDKIFLYDYRANIAQKQKLYDQAKTDYEKALAIDPHSASIENDYGYMLADRGEQLDEAVAMLKKAVTFDPQNAAYLDSLAWAYFKQGQYALAEDLERKAVARSPSDPTLHDHLGEIYAKNGKLAVAISEWEKSLADYATSLAPEADPADVAKVQHKLEGGRVKLAHAGTAPEK
jgi:tetratricopeptide (TPR) repeat protein